VYIIETKNLTKKFGSLTAVDRLSMQIRDGEIFGLLGPNGAGKTTTLSMLSTLTQPTSGSATVDGHDVRREASRVRRSIGFVFQDPSSDDTLTGRENLYLHGLMYGVKGSEINKRMDYVLGLVNLRDRQREFVKNYSGGMRRRLELARGLLHEPKVLFLDEPTLGLDPQTRIHLWTYIKKLSTEKKVTIIITTHYMEEAEMLCDRVAIIDRGKVVVMGTPDDLKKRVGGDIITLKAKAPDMAAVKRLRYVRKAVERDGELVLTVNNASAHLQEILGRVGRVESVELRSPTLNDVFLRYTGRRMREGGEAEGGWAARSMHYDSNKG
jgi:ABC-2 type transport system ATP-binding protein